MATTGTDVDTGLVKGLGAMDATTLVVGSMIGSGIFIVSADIARQVPFKSRFVGDAGLAAWQIVTHVVNHGTHHRGQVSGFLRTMGHTPPPLDLSFYYREQAAHA